MIDKTLKFLADQINSYIKRKTGSATFGQVVLKPVVNQDGHLELDNNSLGMSLINFDEEYTLKQPVNYKRTDDNKVFMTNPAIHLNLIVMVVAHFSSYEEALKFISMVIMYFQNNPVFDKERQPQFDLPGIEELRVKLQPISLENINQIWMALGAKHMPSVSFKVSIAVLNEEEETELPAVKSMEPLMEKL